MLMQFSIPQIILALVALVFLANGTVKFFRKEKTQTLFKFFSNVIIWSGVIVFSLFPKLTHALSEKLGFGESLNTLIFIGFFIVFIILFKIINIIERTERSISEIVRKEALGKLNKK